MPNPCREEPVSADAATDRVEHRTVVSRADYRAGMRAALPLVFPVAALGASFGIVARGLQWGAVAPVAMSIVVFSGSAQFAVASVLGGGGSVAAAILAGMLVNARFLAMGLSAAPATRGGVLRRALEGQVLVDASWALAMRDGSVDRGMLFGASLPQYLGWTAGTVVGVAFGGAIGNPARFGLDALFPAFFLTLLVAELRSRSRLVVGVARGAIALALIPLTPPGLPVIGASCAALLALLER
jgi:4-azaleucine resistance transporter AzlC